MLKKTMFFKMMLTRKQEREINLRTNNKAWIQVELFGLSILYLQFISETVLDDIDANLKNLKKNFCLKFNQFTYLCR